MGDAEKGSQSRVERAIDVSPEELQALSPDRLKALQKKYGLELQIRSTAEGIGKLLGELGRPVDIGMVAEFTRGFDRTSGGFDRYYDRDIPTMEFGEEIINPAERLSTKIDRVAADIARVGKQMREK